MNDISARIRQQTVVACERIFQQESGKPKNRTSTQTACKTAEIRKALTL
jgi:hypothetical protein